ncbi:MAG TPA: putative Ig domain-containing protein, partial [Burkholderiaceae bacterium]|nr:putative Ig domain-containing protein [Burkholderiaceae bacterium]
GVTVNNSGAVTWPKPTAGSFQFTVKANDTRTGLSGNGTVRLQIAAPPQPPVIDAQALSGVAGTAFNGSFSVRDPNGYPLTATISGIPAGMRVSFNGGTANLGWATPKAGSYTLQVKATNSAQLSTSRAVSIQIRPR